MKHFLITQLSSLDEVEIFEKYCFRSVIGQTNKKFIWLVGLKEIPNEIFESWAECQQFQNIEYQDDNDFIDQIQNRINSEAGTNRVIRTYLHWDHAISRDFIQVIQSYSKNSVGSLVINPYLGIRINLKTKVARQEYLSSQVLSLVESSNESENDCQTVLIYDLHVLLNNFPIINIRDHSLWVRFFRSEEDNPIVSTKFAISQPMFNFLPFKFLNQLTIKNSPIPKTQKKTQQKTERKNLNITKIEN